MSFSSLNDFFPQELRDLISNPETPIVNVLSLPYFSQTARIEIPQVTKYLSYHSKELLKLAFGKEGKISSTAYSCLLLGEPDILLPLFHDNAFTQTAADVLSDPNSSSLKIGRLASITLICLAKLNESIFKYCGFLFNFFKRCSNPSAYDFLTTICSNDSSFSNLQFWLNKIQFSDSLLTEFDYIDYSIEFPTNSNFEIYKDQKIIQIRCLYELVSRFCENHILKKTILTPKLATILQKQFASKPPDYIQSARWKAIESATQKEISGALIKLLPESISILSDNFSQLRSYRVSSLLFLTKMLSLHSNAILKIISDHFIPQMLIYQIIQFPNSSIFHSAFVEFVHEALKIPELASQIINLYTPIIISNSRLPSTITKELKDQLDKEAQLSKPKRYVNDAFVIQSNNLIHKPKQFKVPDEMNNITVLNYQGLSREGLMVNINEVNVPGIERLAMKKKRRRKKKNQNSSNDQIKSDQSEKEEVFDIDGIGGILDEVKTVSMPVHLNSEKMLEANLLNIELPPKFSSVESNNRIHLSETAQTGNLTGSTGSLHNSNEQLQHSGELTTEDEYYPNSNEPAETEKKSQLHPETSNQENEDNDSDVSEDMANIGVGKRSSCCALPDTLDDSLIEDKKTGQNLGFNRVLQPCFFSIMNMFLHYSKKNPQIKQLLYSIDGVIEYINGPMNEYTQKAKSNYGGSNTTVIITKLINMFE